MELGTSTESQALQALKDFIRNIGESYCLHHDNSKVQLDKAWNDITRKCDVKGTTIEPYHQWQDPTEKVILDIKDGTHILIDREGANEKASFKAMEYFSFLSNRRGRKASIGRFCMKLHCEEL